MFVLFYGVAIIVILYLIFDVNYFLRFLILIIWDLLLEKKKLLDTFTTYGICIPNDVDILLTHMNNARYLRELDFGRYYYFDRSGIYWAIMKRKGISLLQTATNVRYRRAIRIFMPYKITTKLIYWDDKHLYMEQKFIGLMNNFIYAIILNRHTVQLKNVLLQDIMTDIEPGICRPEPTKELQLWLENIKESSESLKKQA